MAVALPLAALGFSGPSGNMNGKYIVASGDRVGFAWNDDYASKGHEYFDVWAPEISSKYGENFWTDQGNIPLPAHIIERFKGKVMAITGYEQDQVMVNPVGQPGVNPEKDVSVPINWAYNHHYMAWMTGSHSEMRHVEADSNDVSAHGAPSVWRAVDLPSAKTRASNAPTSQMFSEGNGGESRKSFHGYPDGYAQLIDSPTSWHITPMQIDTRNRDCGVTPDSVKNCTKFTPWLEPKQARYGRHTDASTYSGVLECPCNSNFGGDPIFYPDTKTKIVLPDSFTALPSGVCAAGKKVADAATCYDAVAGAGVSATKIINSTISNASLPGGCFVTSNADGTATATYNAMGKGACPSSTLRLGEATSAVNVTFGLKLDASVAGGVATITLSGPADVWFGVGVDAANMADAPYTMVVSPSGVQERKIGTCGSEAEHCAPDSDILAPSLKVLSNTVVGGRRFVVATRPFAGASSKHHTFDAKKDVNLKFITAVGSSPAFGYHKMHMPALLTLLAPAGQPTCFCDVGAIGKLCDNGGVRCEVFTKNCVGSWDGAKDHVGGDLFAQQNPTCNSIQYAGGLRCCGHRRRMIDADQLVAAGDAELRYHMKFRFWFQEYTPGTTVPGVFAHLHGALPAGDDAMPSATLTVKDAVKACDANAACAAITFDSPCRTAHDKPTLVRFKSKAFATDGAKGSHTYVRESQPSHYNLPRYYYTTEANAGEYDIPPAFRTESDPEIPGYPKWPASSKGNMHLTPGSSCKGDCPDGPDCECVHMITYHWTMTNARMIYAGGHCHAPSCISIELWKNDTGTPELLCNQTSHYGTGKVDEDKFDEEGYITLPPCLWGEDGVLNKPVWLNGTVPMISIKRNRNTRNGHYGEMASWQMRGVPFPEPSKQYKIKV